MREVKSVKPLHPGKIRFTTISGSVYLAETPDPDGERRITKNGEEFVSGYLGVATLPGEAARIMSSAKQGIWLSTSPLQDGRVIVPVMAITIQDALGIVFYEAGEIGGAATSLIRKIEIE